MKRIGIITAAAMIFAAAVDSSLDRFGDYDCFHEDQIKWCENKIEAGRREFGVAKSSDVPTLASFHIPTKEFIAEYDATRREKRVLDGVSREHLERTGCSWKGDEMYEARVRLGSTKGIFVGHNHMKKDTILSRDGIRMVYAYSGDHNIYLVLKTGELCSASSRTVRLRQRGSIAFAEETAFISAKKFDDGRVKLKLFVRRLIFWIGCIGIWSVLPVYGAEAESRILLKAGDRYSNYRIPGLVATANGTLLAVA